jgi:dTDP-glucose 4,6-dehydratase
MRILVTGGAGFIGSNFVRHALEAEKESSITVLDGLNYAGNMENLAGLLGNPRFEFVKGDIRDQKKVSQVAKGHDAIVNFAAESHVDYSISNPGIFLSTNVLGTGVLLDAARKNDAAFVQISTDEVYGDVAEGESAEGDLLNPSSPYSASKASADLLVKSYCRTYGMDARITRTTNNYGPYQHMEKLIPKFIILSMMGRKLPIYGHGDSVREWIYVDDNCSAILLAMKKGARGEVYNIGSGERLTVLEVASAILARFGRGASHLSHVDGRQGEDRRYALDSSKIRSMGWKPRVGFGKGLAKTIRWYADNSAWWKKQGHDIGSRHTKIE